MFIVLYIFTFEVYNYIVFYDHKNKYTFIDYLLVVNNPLLHLSYFHFIIKLYRQQIKDTNEYTFISTLAAFIFFLIERGIFRGFICRPS